MSSLLNVFRQARGGVSVVLAGPWPRPDATSAATALHAAAPGDDATSPRTVAAPLSADDAAGGDDGAGGGGGAQLPALLGRERGGWAGAQEEGLLRHPVISRKERKNSRDRETSTPLPRYHIPNRNESFHPNSVQV